MNFQTHIQNHTELFFSLVTLVFGVIVLFYIFKLRSHLTQKSKVYRKYLAWMQGHDKRMQILIWYILVFIVVLVVFSIATLIAWFVDPSYFT